MLKVPQLQQPWKQNLSLQLRPQESEAHQLSSMAKCTCSLAAGVLTWPPERNMVQCGAMILHDRPGKRLCQLIHQNHILQHAATTAPLAMEARLSSSMLDVQQRDAFLTCGCSTSTTVHGHKRLMLQAPSEEVLQLPITTASSTG